MKFPLDPHALPPPPQVPPSIDVPRSSQVPHSIQSTRIAPDKGPRSDFKISSSPMPLSSTPNDSVAESHVLYPPTVQNEAIWTPARSASTANEKPTISPFGVLGPGVSFGSNGPESPTKAHRDLVAGNVPIEVSTEEISRAQPYTTSRTSNRMDIDVNRVQIEMQAEGTAGKESRKEGKRKRRDASTTRKSRRHGSTRSKTKRHNVIVIESDQEVALESQDGVLTDESVPTSSSPSQEGSFPHVDLHLLKDRHQQHSYPLDAGLED